MMEEYFFGGGLGMGFGIIFMLVFWGLIFYLIYWMIKSNRFSKNEGKNLSAKEILKKRLVNGEITKEEFEEILKEIKK